MRRFVGRPIKGTKKKAVKKKKISGPVKGTKKIVIILPDGVTCDVQTTTDALEITIRREAAGTASPIESKARQAARPARRASLVGSSEPKSKIAKKKRVKATASTKSRTGGTGPRKG